MNPYKIGIVTPVRHATWELDSYRVGIAYPTIIGSGGIGDTGVAANLIEEIDSVHAEMSALNSEMFNQMPANLTEPKAQFFTVVWNPFFENWRAWATKETGIVRTTIRAQSIYLQRETWKDLQEFRKRLGEMHAKAIEVGFQLTGPAPNPPKPNVFTETAEQIARPFEEVWKVIKIVLFVGLIVVGGYIVVQFIHAVR